MAWQDTERASFTERDFVNSSTWQETASLVAAGLRWLARPARGDLFIYFSDADNLRHNEVSGRSRNSAVNRLLRLLSVKMMAVGARFHVEWQARTHPMQMAADALSRADVDGFNAVVPDPARVRRRVPLDADIVSEMAAAAASSADG